MRESRFGVERARVVNNHPSRIIFVQTAAVTDVNAGSASATFTANNATGSVKPSAASTSIAFTSNNATISTVEALNVLYDNFDDGSIDPLKWPNSYGGVAEAGGRAQIDCDVLQFSGLKSKTSYYLDESFFLCQAFPAAANTATIAYFSLLVTTTTPGTDAGFNIDTASNGIAFLSRVGFSDPGAVFATYDPVNDAWLRLRETSDQTFWETSPDGSTWTIRRTETSPVWVTNTNLAFVAEAHRDAGTDNVSELDNFNLITDTASAGSASATITANNATTSIQPHAGVATATIVSNNATTSLAPHADFAPITFTANNATVTVGTNVSAGIATFSVAANNASGSVAPHAGNASASLAAQNATVRISTSAANAAFSIAANNATVSEAPHAGVATSTFTANNATIQIAPTSTNALIALTANNVTAKVQSSIDRALLSFTANNASVITGAVVSPGSAATTFTANNSTINVMINAGVAMMSYASQFPTHAVHSTAGVNAVHLSILAENATVVTSHTQTDTQSWGFTL